MSTSIPACTWGARLAVPLEGEGWTSTMDDVRALVDALHRHLNVDHPMDDFFLNLLGTARLAGRAPIEMKHLRGRVVVLGAYKIRQPHIAALHDIAMNSAGVLKRLAQATCELGKARLCDTRDALAPEVRGEGPWCWSSEGTGHYEAIAQELRAWEHFGATPRDLREELVLTREQLAQMEKLHGGTNPIKWKWGKGTPCADVHAADDAKHKYEALKAKLAAFAPLCDRGESSQRARSRSPRR